MGSANFPIEGVQLVNEEGSATPPFQRFIEDVDGNTGLWRRWHPDIYGDTDAGDKTLNANRGMYIKLGPLVIYTAQLNWESHTGTGPLTISLPIPPATKLLGEGESETAASWAQCLYHSSLSHTAGTYLQARIGTANNVKIYEVATGGGGSSRIDIEAAGNIQISGMYLAEE